MENDVRTMLTARLAERGLKLHSFEGQILTVHYHRENDSAAENGQTVDVGALSRYVRDVLRDLPGGDTMFPRLQDIVVEVCATD
jgi:hypothetical protein